MVFLDRPVEVSVFYGGFLFPADHAERRRGRGKKKEAKGKKEKEKGRGMMKRKKPEATS